MATFNPQIQDVPEQQYWRMSKAIEQPKPDMSGAVAISGAAKALETGLQGLDTVVKEGVGDEAYNTAKSIQKDETQRLAALDFMMKGNNTDNGGQSTVVQNPDPRSLLSGMSYDPANAGAVPDEIKRLPQVIETLNNAKSNGKLSLTDYHGRLDAAASDLRARWPGMRDVIDRQFEKATGVNAANAMINDLVSRINAGMEGQQDQIKKARAELWSAANKGNIKPEDLQGMWAQLDKNGIKALPSIIGAISASNKAKYDAELFNLQHTAQSNQRQNVEWAFTDGFPKVLDSEIDAAEATFNAKNGWDVNKWKADVEQGIKDPVSVDDTLMAQRAVQLQGHYDTLRASLIKASQREVVLPDGTKTSVWARLGEGAVNKMIDSKLGLLKSRIDLIAQKKPDLANFSEYYINSMKSMDMRDIINGEDRDLGTFHRKLLLTKGSPAYEAKAVEYFASSGMPDKLDKFMMNRKFNASTGNTDGGPPRYTLNKDIDAAKKADISDGQFYSTLTTGQLERFVAPETSLAEKQSLFKYFFAKENWNTITKLNRDNIDPATGQVLPYNTKGRYSFWTRLTSDDVIRQVKALGNNSWEQYQDWVTHEYKQMNRDDLRDLNNTLTNNPNVVVKWNSKNLNFDVDVGATRSIQDAELAKIPGEYMAQAGITQRSELATVQNSIKMFNNSIKGLARVISAKDSRDVEVAVLENIKANTGMDLTRLDPKSLPGKMVQAVMAEAAAKRAEADAGKARGEENSRRKLSNAAKLVGSVDNPLAPVELEEPMQSAKEMQLQKDQERVRSKFREFTPE